MLKDGACCTVVLKQMTRHLSAVGARCYGSSWMANKMIVTKSESVKALWDVQLPLLGFSSDQRADVALSAVLLVRLWRLV
jgi:hypothetical protein